MGGAWGLGQWLYIPKTRISPVTAPSAPCLFFCVYVCCSRLVCLFSFSCGFYIAQSLLLLALGLFRLALHPPRAIELAGAIEHHARSRFCALMLLAVVLVLGAKLSLVVEHLLRDQSPDRHVRDVELVGWGRAADGRMDGWGEGAMRCGAGALLVLC